MSVRRHCVIALASGHGAVRVERDALSAAAVLTYRVGQDDAVTGVNLTTFDKMSEEPRALAAIDRLLSAQHAIGATLVAYDATELLNTLVARARRHWLFDTFDLPRWTCSRAGVLDLAGLHPRSATLSEACAASGIRGAEALVDGFGTQLSAARWCELSVYASALLHCHLRASDARSPLPILRGWKGLLAHVSRARPHLDHCAGFRCDGMVDPDVLAMVSIPAPRRTAP